jgi:hypothetical protein
MAFTFYPAVAIFAVLVNMGLGEFLLHPVYTTIYKNSKLLNKKILLCIGGEELALDIQSQYPTHYNLMLFL